MALATAGPLLRTPQSATAGVSINRGAGLQHHAPLERQTPHRTVAADPFLPPRLRYHMLMSRCGIRWWPPYLARYRSVASMKPIYSPAGIRYIMESGIIIIVTVFLLRQTPFLSYGAQGRPVQSRSPRHLHPRSCMQQCSMRLCILISCLLVCPALRAFQLGIYDWKSADELKLSVVL